MSSLQNKLKNYEVVPPAQAWDKIAAALDETTETPQYPSALYNMELAPPAAAWANINAELDATDTRVVPLRKRTSFFYRYAVAAAIVIIAALGVIKWIVGNDHSSAAGTAIATPSNDSGIPGKATNTGTAPTPNTETSAPSPMDREPVLLARVEPAVKMHLHKTAAAGISSSSYTYDETAGDVYNNPIYAYEDHVPNLADRYIMLMTPEGKFIRMSKKLGSLVCCVSGEEQDADCKDQLKKWQEKMAAAPGSPGNFLDILSLVNSLDDSNGL